MILSLLFARQPGGCHLVILACCAIAFPVNAEVTVTDIQVAARALSFVSNPPRGALQLGIVYTPENSYSRQQATNLRRQLAGGLKVGTLELHPVLVPSDGLRNVNVDLLFLIEGLDPEDAARVAAGSKQQKMLCITTNIDLVRNGSCVMGVQSRPKVEIFINRSAATSIGITFSTVFRVMITEL